MKELMDFHLTCRVWPVLREELRTMTIETTTLTEIKCIKTELFPLTIANPSDILYIEDSDVPMYRAGTYLHYGAYTKTREESVLLRCHLSNTDIESQRILNDYRLYSMKNNKLV